MKALRLTIGILLCIALLAPFSGASARDFVKSVETGRKIDINCHKKPAKQQGRCVSDVIKQWQRERELFKKGQNAEKDAWLLEHASMGVTSDYTEALTAFNKAQQQARKVFDLAQREARKALFARMKEQKDSQSSSSVRSHTQRVDNAAELAAKERCNNEKDTTALRICMRQQLRLVHPSATARGAANWRTREQ